MRNDIDKYDDSVRRYIMDEWVDLIFKGIAKGAIIGSRYVPYLQYEDGSTYFTRGQFRFSKVK